MGEPGDRYPLSPKDMCTVELLPEIVKSGIMSLKIEGRMKKPEYTAGVVSIYRKYLDLYEKNAVPFPRSAGGHEKSCMSCITVTVSTKAIIP
mgnify:CR=1 FL=1